MLIYRSSRLWMFFKVDVLKNFAILEPLSNNKVADLVFTPTVAASANTFLQLNMVIIADSRTGFCFGLL